MGDAGQVLDKIARLADDALCTSPELEDYAIDGVQPQLLVAPKSEEQLTAMVRECGHGEVLFIPHGCTRRSFDLRRVGDTRPTVLVSMQKLNQLIDYSPQDLTLTVQAGMTFADLAAVTGECDQYFPLDPPNPRRATLGGAVAANAHGPRGLSPGGFKHFMLGGTTILANGRAVRSGARTVKNVAGYDLYKLFIGSFGSLGIVTRLDLRLHIRPSGFRIAELPTDGTQAALDCLSRIMRGDARPSLVVLLNAVAAAELGRDLNDHHILLYLGYEGTVAAIEWQVDQLRRSYGDRVYFYDAHGSREQFETLVEWPARQCEFSFEAITTCGQRASFFESCNRHGIGLMSLGANGLTHGRSCGDLTTQIAEELREAAGEDGSVKFIKLPQRSQVSRWGEMNKPRKWMRAIKEQFDPQHIFPWPGFLGR